MSAILSGIIPYLTWATGDVFAVVATRKSNAFLASFFNFIFSFFVYALYVPFALKDLNNLTLGTLIICIALGGCFRFKFSWF